MLAPFRHIEFLYSNASVQVPNDVFQELSGAIRGRSGKANVQQASFAYVYLVAIAFLYKYTQFVDLEHGTYLQNGDLKELLGYSRSTKSIDRILKKGGILDQLGLTRTVHNYPVRFYLEPVPGDDYPRREFVLIQDLDETDLLFSAYQQTVKNRNYEIKEPLFLTGSPERESTLSHFERTHKITIQEFIRLVEEPRVGNIDFLLYGYFKSRCFGYVRKSKTIPLCRITQDVGIDSTSFYRHLASLKAAGYLQVKHSRWKTRTGERHIRMVSNTYKWKGIS